MLDPNLIREDTEKVKDSVKNRGMSLKIVDNFLKLDEEWRKTITDFEKLRAEKNKLGKDDRDEAAKIKEKEKKLSEVLKKLEAERRDALEKIPNLVDDRVPVGKNEDDNEELKTWGDIPQFDFEPKDHMELGEALGIIDTDKAAEVSGSRFSYILGDLALLEFALVKYVFDKIIPHGFVPVIPPVLVKSESMKMMGKGKFIDDDDAYYLPEDDLYLVGTSEDAIGPMHMNEKFKKGDLPKRYAGFSTAFRREAGTYGKDTKGIFRRHQFDKVEMFSFTNPEDSVAENDFLLERQEEIIQGLELPYRVMRLCTGEIGFTATNQYDIEVWLPSENKYRESHSCSNTTDFQSRGLSIKTANGEYAHMLNATGAAMRLLVYIIENNQTKDGSIKIPKVLQDYAGKAEIKISQTS